MTIIRHPFQAAWISREFTATGLSQNFIRDEPRPNHRSRDARSSWCVDDVHDRCGGESSASVAARSAVAESLAASWARPTLSDFGLVAPLTHLPEKKQQIDWIKFIDCVPQRTHRRCGTESLVIHPTHAAHTAARHGRRARILLRPFGNHRFRCHQEASDRTRVL